MKTFLASVAAAALMTSAAVAQQVILVPQGEGAGGQQQFILVPVPQPEAGAQGASGQEMRDRAEAMALDLYRRGYQRGMADAQSAGGPAFDPSAMEQIGRELFERGYMLGMMQAQAQMTNSQMPVSGDKEQADAGTQGEEKAAAGTAGEQAEAGQASQQQVTPEEVAQATQEAIGQATGQDDQAGQSSQQQVTPEAVAQAAQETTGQTTGEMPQAIIRTEQSDEHGTYLVDANGRAVYLLEADKQGEGDQQADSTCYEDCAEVWPPVLTQGTPPVAEGDADEGMLSMIEREDGTMQVTYDGWPLYYYVKDEGAGEATGQDVQDAYGEWYLLQPSGEKVGE